MTTADLMRLASDRDTALIEQLNSQLISANAKLEMAAACIRELERKVDELMCWTVGAFIDGELDDERASAFRRHLAKCEGCRHEVVALGAIAARVQALRHTCG